MEDAVAGSASPPTLLSLFWDLASLDKGARLDAAEKLVRALDFEPVEPDSDVEMDDADGSQQLIDAALSTDTAYSLKRLVRGLPSSRLGARQGFSVALTELLSRLSGVPLAAILDLLEKHTVVTGSAKGSEEKEMLLGRLFGLAAVVHSGYLARDSTESEDILRLANTLVTLSASKSYLAEPAFAVLGSMIPDIAKRPDAESLASELAKAALDPLDTFDALALALALQSAFPNLDWQELLPEWKKGDLLRSENLEKLAAPCLESSKAHPRVHSGWKVLLEALVGGGKKKIGIKEFWDGVVESRLLNSSHERRYLALRLPSVLLPLLPPPSRNLVLTPSFFRTLGNALAEKDNLLHKAAQSCGKELVGMGLGPALISGLNPRASAVIAGQLPADSLADFGAHLVKEFLRPPVENVEVHRLWCASQLASLCKPARGLEHLKRIETLQVLFSAAALDEQSGEAPVPAFSEATRETVKGRFLAALNDACAGVSKKEGEDGWRSVSRELGGWAAKQVGHAILPAKEACDAAAGLAKKIGAAEGKLGTIEMLAWFSAIRSFFEPDAVSELLPDLTGLHARLANPKKRKSDADAPEPDQVIADLCISLLASPDALWRGMSERVFREWATGMGSSVLVEAIEGEVEVGDDMEVDEEEGDDHEGHDHGDDEDESGEDEEESEDDDSDESDKSDSDAESDDGDAADHAELAELRKKLAEAMEMDAKDLDKPSDDEESDEDALDDDQMEALDDKLAAIFRMRKQSGKKQKEEAERQAVAFKMRVLELLDIWGKKNAESGEVLEVVGRLLGMLKGEKAGQFKDKLAGLLGRLVKSKGYTKGDVRTDKAGELVGEAIGVAESGDKLVGGLAAGAVLLCVKVVEASNEPAARKRVVEAYVEAFKRFLGKKGAHPSLFLQLNERFPEVGIEVSEGIVGMLDGTQGKAWGVAQGYGVVAGGVAKVPSSASKELIAKATEVYKKAVKSAIKALSGEAESEDKEKDRRKSKSKKAEKAAAETPAAHIEIPAERRKEILKHLLNSARRLKNLHGEKWDEVKKGLALAKLEKAVGGDKEGVKSVAAQLSAL